MSKGFTDGDFASKLSSDYGSHFVKEALTQVGKCQGVDLRSHCASYPASVGAVERENDSAHVHAYAGTGQSYPF